jgi:DNA-binding transcriptional LysR family regulator
VTGRADHGQQRASVQRAAARRFPQPAQRLVGPLALRPRLAPGQQGSGGGFCPEPAAVFRGRLRDRYLVAADRDHPEIGDRITLEQFSTLPYLATSSGHNRSLADMQLDFLGIPRNVEITTGFGLAPFLLRGTRLITLVHERLAQLIGGAAGIRLLEPPIPQLQPITEIMVWTPRTEPDPGHRWLRNAIIQLAESEPDGVRS